MTTCPTCSGTIIEYSASAGNGFCVSCGTVVEENTIVNEITFGETSSGAAMVQGSYVGQSARGARIGGPFGNRGSMESREQTMMNANKKIRQIATVLRLPETISQKAARYYELAVETKFTKGRKSIYVVASCLYVVSREAKSSVMLIDFSDLLQVNVFILGSTYLALLASLSLHSSIPPIDPSIYIPRFASLLEFGPETQQVSIDAIRICSRFNRDWLVIGRRPSGICGAALYIAARMNNFRRSVSEIVQVVKIGDSTLRKRLGEFGKTGSAELSVESFRGVWIEEEGAPPAFEKGREKEERERLRAIAIAMEESEKDSDKVETVKGVKKKGRKRKRTEVMKSDAERTLSQETTSKITRIPIDPALLNTGILTGTTADESQSASLNSSSIHIDPDAPPYSSEIPLFFASDEEEEPRPLRRSQSEALKSKDLSIAERALPVQSEYEKALDKRLQEEIGGIVGDMEGLVNEGSEDSGKGVPGVRAVMSPTVNGSANENNGPPNSKVNDPTNGEVNTEISTASADLAAEAPEMNRPATVEDPDSVGTFSEDIERELDTLILSPTDVTIKERVWVELNRDYLVQIALKAEREAREEREGGSSTAKVRKKRKTAQKPRDASTPAGATTSESVRSMVKKGNKFSKRINYDAIENLFGSSNPTTNDLSGDGKLYSFGKDRDSSVDLDIQDDRAPPTEQTRREYPYNERYEGEIEEGDEDGEGELVQIIEEGEGGVGIGNLMGNRQEGIYGTTFGQVDEDGGDTTAIYDQEDYIYNEVYEQEV